MQDKRANILIVDDRPENLHAMKITLAPLEAEIFTAGSGNEALAELVKNEFAVVLLDVQMPGMDGFETAALMQNNRATRNVPIIFVTAISKDEQHVFKGYEAGAVDYLFKPVNPDILLSKVRVFINLYKTRLECERMQQELQRARNLESLGLLAGGIAHDFNNLLTAILGNISSALRSISPQDEKTRHRLLEAEKASVRAKGLTRQLLTFAKGGAPIKELASIVEIINDSAEFVLHGSTVKCRYGFEEDLWPVEIDKGQVGQVIQNIIINAMQAMPNGGEIDVCCNKIRLDPENCQQLPDGKYVLITIKDHGEGIAADMVEKIFDPYFTTKPDGNGLGLATSHSIITKHNGHISATSEEGIGTKFSIYLPAAEGTLETVAEKREPLQQQDISGKILVMDDDQMIRDFVREILTDQGYEVLVASDGQEAVAIYEGEKETKSPVNLVIMDLTVAGGMGGKEAMDLIGRMDPAARCIVSSGYSNDPIMANYQQYGFCAAIAKPFELDELIRIVGECLSLP